MRSSGYVVAYVALATLSAGCGPSFDVRTMAAPDAGLSTIHTFRILPGPNRRDGRDASGSDDPMISNSIANRAIRDQIVKSLEDRGYALDDRNADVGVAFYASARQQLDVTVWDYGYPFSPRWRRYPEPEETITPYTEGTVIVDLVGSSSKELLWRGEAKAHLSNDASRDVGELTKAASSIVARLPHATTRVTAEQ